jgi:glycosyltransferase involved in cell wall biosynthesis
VKGHDLLFQALSCDRWRSRDWQVTLYGGGTMEAAVRRMCLDMKLDRVQFGGYADPREIWRRNHALLLPSRAEGLPIAMVEAMLSGRFCIATDAGGNAEMLDDNVTGFIAHEVSAAGLDDAMERAWQRRREWHSLGDRAARRARAIIPPDPVGQFVEELERVAKG